MSRFKVLAALAVVGMLVVACGPAGGGEAATVEDEWGVIEINPGENVRIAVATVTSGAGVDVLGLDELRGAELAVDARPEVLGFPIEIVAEDTLCSAEGGQTVANRLAADPTIVALVGHSCSSSCRPAAEIYEQAHMTMISPSCTAPSLTSEEEHVGAFLRVVFNDDFQGPVAADFAYNQLGARNVATIHDGSPYAEQLVASFSRTFEELGGTVVAAEAINVGDTDMRPVLTTIAAEGPDLIYAPIFPAEAGFIAAQRGDVGLGDVAFMGADGIWATTFIEAAGDAAEGVYASGPGAGGAPYEEFVQNYTDKYGEAPVAAFHAHAYDALNVIVDAIEEVGVVGSDGVLRIGRQALRNAIYGTSGFEGLTGTLSCTELGDCGAEHVAIGQVQESQFVVVYAP